MMVSLLSCKNDNTDNLNNNTANNDLVFNDDSKKPFKERLVNYADWYCKNNLKSFAGHEMSISTSDIIKIPLESKNKGEEFYVFTYNNLSKDLKYVLDGEVIIRFLNNEFSLKKDYLHINDDYITVENSAFMLSEAGGGEKILFSRKY